MSFPHQLKTPKQEVRRHEYHSLKTVVLKGNLFSEVGAHAASFPDRQSSSEHRP